MSHFFRYFVTILTVPVRADVQGQRGNTYIAGQYKHFPCNYGRFDFVQSFVQVQCPRSMPSNHPTDPTAVTLSKLKTSNKSRRCIPFAIQLKCHIPRGHIQSLRANKTVFKKLLFDKKRWLRYSSLDVRRFI